MFGGQRKERIKLGCGCPREELEIQKGWGLRSCAWGMCQCEAGRPVSEMFWLGLGQKGQVKGAPGAGDGVGLGGWHLAGWSQVGFKRGLGKP